MVELLELAIFLIFLRDFQVQHQFEEAIAHYTQRPQAIRDHFFLFANSI
jgi:hypothetical protein